MNNASGTGELVLFLAVGLLTLAAAIAVFIWARRAAKAERIGNLGVVLASVFAAILFLGGGVSLGIAILTGACGTMTFH